MDTPDQDVFLTKLDYLITLHNRGRDKHLRDRDDAIAKAQCEQAAASALEEAREEYLETKAHEETT